jgi:prepilin-type N-terminal cleavage/methylation domain-containing protein
MTLSRSLRGFTLLELIVVIVIISVLGTVALGRLRYYQERAEKAMMEYTLEAVTMGLRIHMAELMVSNRSERLRELERENPMRWMEEPPTGYAGEYVMSPKPGNWYFISDKHELVYVPKYRDYLEGGEGNGRELHFRPALHYLGNAESGTKSVVGVGMAPVNKYQWFGS